MVPLAALAGLDGSPASAESHIGFWLVANGLWSHTLSSSRGLKWLLGIDNHVNPRVDKYGSVAVRNGKITQAQLDRVGRNDSAHHNSMEHFPVFAAAVILAQVAGLPAQDINFAGFLYLGFRVGFWLNYVLSRNVVWASLRPLFWWGSNIVCFRLIWKAGQALA